MIEFKNVQFAYPDGPTVLKNIDLKINPGEKTALVGSNGSGKTTLALMINGLLKPSSGDITVAGLNPVIEADAVRLKQKVGLVFQNPDNQLVASSVEREVAFALENMATPHPQLAVRVDEILKHFGFYEMRNRLTAELSGGEKQRLALAGVMVGSPEILILDEPESYLDENGKETLNLALQNLIADNPNLTLIHITQYARTALNYPRLIGLHKGEIMADDAPSKIFGNESKRAEIGIPTPFEFRANVIIGKNPEETKIENEDLFKSRVKAIECRQVCFSYEKKKENRLFDNVSLNLKNDRIYGLVGPSASGKTTLLQLLAGLIKPEAGTITYSGFRPDKNPVAVSFQQPERQFFLDTVDEEIEFAARNMQRRNIEELVDDSYVQIGLKKEAYALRDPISLSGGEKRRLAFGTLLPMSPSFFLFDEPTCGLDVNGITQFKSMVKNLQQEGTGIVIVSHDGDIIFDLAEDIIVLEQNQPPGLIAHREFFMHEDYYRYLSEPDAITFQKKRFGEIRYFDESELLSFINSL